MKRWMPFLLIICVVLLLPAVSVAARAADTSGACGDNLTWTFDEGTGTLTIDGTGPMWDWSSAPWYAHASSIKSVIIHNGVTSIENNAFHNCTSLTQVTIPNSVTSIGSFAFSDCRNLTAIHVNESNTQYCSVDGVLFDKPQTKLIQYPTRKQGRIYAIPDSVTYIVGWAFARCENLTQVTIPDSVTRIGDCAFFTCTGLTQVTIGNNVTAIGEYAFAYCDNLTQVAIGDSVTPIGKYAFAYCDNLTQVTIGDSVTAIGDYAFSECKNLTQVTIGNSITVIGMDAFSYCNSLEQVTIPNSVTHIYAAAFEYCTSLAQVTIPNSVTVIGGSAFYNCTGLTDVYYKGTEKQWDSITIYTKNDSLLNANIHYAFDTETGAVSIPPLPKGVKSALIAAYEDGKLLCTVTGKVGNDNYIPLAVQPDEIRIFYLGDNYQPVTAPDIIPLD